jgi:hypothetical protein
LSRRDIETFYHPLHDSHTATMMPVPRRQIPILIVAGFLSRLPRYSLKGELADPQYVIDFELGVISMDDALGLTASADGMLADTRTRRNGRHALIG